MVSIDIHKAILKIRHAKYRDECPFISFNLAGRLALPGPILGNGVEFQFTIEYHLNSFFGCCWHSNMKKRSKLLNPRAAAWGGGVGRVVRASKTIPNYAIFFRSICICDKEACKISRTWPPEPSIYVTTMHAINSGVVKLARQQATMQLPQVLYRGCSHPSAAVLNAYLARDRAAMVEPCVLAFSQDRKVGVRYAKHFPGVLLELDAVQGSFIWGADVEWLTQFPMQYEVLFPALTQLDIVDGPLTKQEKNGISVYKARVVLNAYSCTLEELSLQSSMHKSLECQSLVEGISATDASVKDQRQLVVREDGNGTCCGKEKDI